MMTVGIVGLGNIGLPAALNLLKAGFTVTGYSRRRVDPFIAAGGRMAEDPRGVAACDVILHTLPNTEALVATIDALIPQLKPGQIIVELSSYPLRVKQEQADRVAITGAVMLDGEISGLPFQVAERSAVIFIAGDHAAAARCAPILDAFSARHFFLGAFGAATKMKLIANYMVCAHNLVGAEALNMGAAAGLNPSQMIEVLKPSAAGSATFANKAALMISREFQSGRGPFSHMFGHLDRALALARESGVEGATPVLETVRAVYDIARTELRHDQDIAGIIEVVEAMGTATKDTVS